MEPARLALAPLLACAALAIAASTTSPASAREPARRADPLSEGLALAAAGESERALAKFEEAYANAPTPTALFHLARMEHVLGEHALAAQRYRAALADPGFPEELRREVESALEDVERKVGVLSLDVPAGAVASVDGSVVDPGAPLEVVPGTHVVKIRLGGETASAFVTAPAGVTTPVALRFGAEGADERSEGAAAVAPRAAVGTRWPRAKVASVVGGSAASAGLLAASGVLFAMAGAKRTADSSQCVDPASPSCAMLLRERASYDSARTASAVTLTSGLALGALTVVAAVLWPNERVRVGPTPAATSGWSLRF